MQSTREITERPPRRSREEQFVPLHTTELVNFLADNPSVKAVDKTAFQQLAALILSLLHHLYRQRHESLTYHYDSLDPDRDRIRRTIPTPKERERSCAEVLTQTQVILNRANYERLDLSEIQAALEASSQWGVRMRVDFSSLKALEVYARGDIIGERFHRNWRSLFRAKMVEVPLYQRLVVLFRIHGDAKNRRFDPECVYLRMFKNVPRQDVDMMLPAVGIQMTWLDHSKIVVPSLYAAGITLWRVLRNVMLLALTGIYKTVGLALLVVFAIGFGVRSMFNYRANTQRRYMLNMTQSLYYQNLDNNAGVLLRLLEEGEQQEGCEMLLAYFALAFSCTNESSTTSELAANCKALLQEATGMNIGFNADDSLRRLVHFGIVRSSGRGWVATPPAEAVAVLNKTWDSWFAG